MPSCLGIYKVISTDKTWTNWTFESIV